KNPKDVRALYALGNSNATLAAFEATVKRAKLSAYGPAKKARELHQQVLRLNPNFHDARIAIGTYDYVVSVIPRILRFLFGIGGTNKATGIRELETAAAKSTLALTDARMLLSVVYIREARYNEALRILNDLHAKYPRNFIFELSKASVYEKMKQWDRAIQIYEEVLRKIMAKENGYDRLREEKIFYKVGDTNIHRQQFDRAVEAFARVVAGKDSTPDEKAGAHLWMGKIFDSKKDRKKAIEQYDAVLTLNCDPELRDEARRYKRQPYGE
ncbi:MAG: DUF3808 domain-containing protein, partial [Acidobacteria bacterium]|nr:DUF3808 domain-containing protein [Acidobacteriota bacterium]